MPFPTTSISTITAAANPDTRSVVTSSSDTRAVASEDRADDNETIDTATSSTTHTDNNDNNNSVHTHSDNDNPPSSSSSSSLPMPVTSRYTDAEWEALLAETARHVRPGTVAGRDDEDSADGDRSRPRSRPVPSSLPALAKTIDHTLLKLDATPAQIDALCSEARTENFKSVCVRIHYVPRCVKNLKGTDVLVACVIGFPEGTHDTYQKLAEAQAAVAAGAAELDIVLNHALLASAHPRRHSTLYTELASLRTLCPPPTVLKLILETSALRPHQIVQAAHLASAARFDFIKTSTGFHGRGATVQDVRLMAAAAAYLARRDGPHASIGRPPAPMRVKASGGIRGLDDCLAMLRAGADRIGTSSGVWIMQEARLLADELAAVGVERKEKSGVRRGGGTGKGSKCRAPPPQPPPTRPTAALTRLYTDNELEEDGD